MGGRGSFSKGYIPDVLEYHTVGEVDGVKVVIPKDDEKSLKLPEESNTSRAYVLYDKDGVFHQYREYNENHEIILEIGYHHEKKLLRKGEEARDVLHVHVYDPPGIDNRGKVKTYILYSDDPLYFKHKALFIGVKPEVR